MPSMHRPVAIASLLVVAAGAAACGSMTGSAAPESRPTISLADTSPAGPVTMPDPMMQMAPGMQMAGPSCTTVPTTAQQRAAVGLVDTSWADNSKYESLAVAKAAGYRPITPTGAPVVHYLSQAAYRAVRVGGPVIDPAAPQSLVYANTAAGAVLAAVMYIEPSRSAATPDPGGCLTQWHVHTNLCFAPSRGVVGTTTATGCPAGSSNRVTPPMLHVWFVPIPGGPTAVDASDAQVVAAASHVPHPTNPAA